MALQFTGNTVRSHRIVSLVAGPVAVDGEGRAAVDLPVPAFDGRLAVSVVAWSADRVGQADAKILVRGPVVAELTRPRFLGTGDLAELVLEVQPGEGPLGRWQAELAADGALTLDPAGPLAMEVAPGRLYLNPGAWMDGLRYAVVTAGGAELRQYGERGAGSGER